MFALATACWAWLAVVWVVAARRTRVRATGDDDGIRRRRAAARMLLIVLVGSVVLTTAGILVGEQSPPGLELELTWLAPIGLALLVAGTALATWARLALGSSWTVDPRVVGDRRLRTGGPYAVTRHPIYSGVLAMLVGSALLSGIPASALVVLAGLLVAEMKIQREERLLLTAFPEEYPRYRDRVPQLIPGLGGLGH